MHIGYTGYGDMHPAGNYESSVQPLPLEVSHSSCAYNRTPYHTL